MRRWLEEWGLPVLGAIPFIAWYVWLDHNPSLGGVLLFNVVMGALGGAVAIGGGVLMLAEDHGPWWKWVLIGGALGSWLNLTLPVVMPYPWTGGPWDTLARLSWTASGVFVLGVAVRHAPSCWTPPFVLLLNLPFNLALWGGASSRLVGLGGCLFGVLVLAAIGARTQAAKDAAEPAVNRPEVVGPG